MAGKDGCPVAPATAAAAQLSLLPLLPGCPVAAAAAAAAGAGPIAIAAPRTTCRARGSTCRSGVGATSPSAKKYCSRAWTMTATTDGDMNTENSLT
jgi:hypothetical protein